MAKMRLVTLITGDGTVPELAEQARRCLNAATKPGHGVGTAAALPVQ